MSTVQALEGVREDLGEEETALKVVKVSSGG